MSEDRNLYLTIAINEEMYAGHVKYLAPFLDTIVRRVHAMSPKLPVLEIGIGTGLCSIYLSNEKNLDVYAIDIEESIVKRFKGETVPKFKSKVKAKVADAFDLHDIKKELRKFACIFHQGLLEHFQRKDIIELLDHHTSLCNGYVIFAVPVNGYARRESKYDEHESHWSIEEWLALVSRYTLFEYGAFGIDDKAHQAYFVIRAKPEGV